MFNSDKFIFKLINFMQIQMELLAYLFKNEIRTDTEMIEAIKKLSFSTILAMFFFHDSQ